MSKKGRILLIIFIGLTVYFNSLFNGFVWDDEEQILTNTLIHSFSNVVSFFMGSTFNTGGAGGLAGMYYKPMMSAFFSLIYTIFGPNALFFHLFQLIVHIINSILVFLFFRYFFKQTESLIGAIIFLVHPAIAETVIYISALQDAIFFLFGMLALLKIPSVKTLKSIIVLTFLFLLSLLSKETGFLFIPVALIFSFLFHRKTFYPVIISVSSAILSYFFLRFGMAKIYFNKSGPSPIMQITFAERLQTIPQIIFTYLRNFLFPRDLAVAQHWVVKNSGINNFVLPLIIDLISLIILITGGFYLYLKKNDNFKIYLFFFCWLIIGLSLHLQIFPLDMTVAERWFYFPMMGLIGLLLTFWQSFSLNKQSRKIIIIILCLIIFILGLRTIIRNADFKDGLTLYTHDSTISVNAFDLENNLGVELYRSGNTKEAAKHFEKSTILAPHWWTNWNNLGVITENLGNTEKATEYYQKAVDNGKYYLAYENLAKIYLKSGNLQKTSDFCKQSLFVLPNNPVLWTILAMSEYKLNNKELALTASKNAFLLLQNESTYLLYQKILKNENIDPQN